MSELLREFYDDHILVFGHRGARAYAPMNTLPSFELALAQGADGVELDVRLTRDGAMILMHDERVDATTDGHGLVRDFTLAEIKALDAGAWFGATFAGTRVATLDEVFEAIGHKLLINVEIKAESARSDGVEPKVAEAIRRHGLERRVILSSFNPLTLRRFRAVLPEVPIGFLYEQETPAYLPHLMIGLPHEARNPHYPLIDAKYMDWAKRSGYRVNTWTVNNPARAVTLRDLGVDCVITDTPDVILAAVRGQWAMTRLWWRTVRFGFDLLYNDLAFTYDHVSWIVSLGAWRCWTRTALKYLDAGSPILELAHGTGNLQLDLHAAGHQPVGYDLSPTMGRIAQAKLQRHGLAGSLMRGRAQQLPFASASFAGVVSTFPTDFITTPETVREVYRVLKPGGVFVVVPNAILTGGNLVERGLERLYQVTGQRGGSTDTDRIAAKFAPFAVTIHEERCPRSLVTIIVARKTA